MLIHQQLLRRAKRKLARTWVQYIELDRPIYVCRALEACSRNDKEFEAAEEIKRHIHWLLGDAETYEEWLVLEGVLPARMLPLYIGDAHRWTPELFQNLQRSRLAWIDWMIWDWSEC